MGKGDTRRPSSVSEHEVAIRWAYAFRPKEEEHLVFSEWLEKKKEMGKVEKSQ